MTQSNILPNPQLHSDWESWAKAWLQFYTNQRRSIELVELPRLSAAALLAIDPTDAEGKAAYVYDEANDGILALSDGTNWKRFTPDGNVS